MQKILLLLLLPFLFFSIPGLAQNDYQMQPGEVIYLDKEGKIINSNLGPSSKNNPGTTSSTAVKSSDLNEDGTLKIPGYTPTGNKEVDAQNYKKAKLLLYQNKPQEYNKWVQKNNSLPHPNHFQEIPRMEFNKMPKIKQDHISAHPEKYKIVDNR